MIIYLDTSSFVKLYVEEAFSDKICDLLKKCDIAATSQIAYAEARAAFARRYREKAYSQTEYQKIVTDLNQDWRNYLIVPITNELIFQAGELAETYALRGFDSIHLASAMTLRQKSGSEISFSCFDSRLNAAAKKATIPLV
ncbi:MAG: type II toxin-antitoxin system VapC family toxin [SAR324 cluster bacterium]|nr:type II toxin-antitoxin system VapC family toxin [SAR324 cluster bacterium]